MKNGRLLVLLFVVFLLLVFVSSIVAIVVMLDGEGGGGVEDGSTLVLSLGGEMPDQPPTAAPLSSLGNTPLSVFEVDSGLKRAAADEDITQLLVYVNPMGVGFGKIAELRDAIEAFSVDSGKPVTCWMEQASNKEYLLSTACDRVFMAPEGFFLVNGLHLSVTFYKGTLDKLGVKAEFTRAGKYKSAIEPLTSTEMSDPYRDMMESLADSLYDHMVQAVAERRGMEPAAVKAIIDDPPLTARAAYEAGLIDGLLYDDQLRAYLAGKPIPPSRYRTGAATAGDDDDSSRVLAATADDDDSGLSDAEIAAIEPGAPLADDDDSAAVSALRDERIPARDADDDDPPRVGFRTYLDRSSSRGKGERIAVVFCEGQITSGESRPGSSMGSDTIAAAIRKARLDDDTAAIVLRVDSPGGSGLASDIMWREVELARSENGLPVVVSMSDLAASGGYYISMGADAIVSQPTTLTGSIGVFAGKYDISGTYEKIGLTTESIKRGEYSDLFAMNKGLGPDGVEKLEEFVDSFYATFLQKAAAGRDTSPAAIHDVAQGRVWTGEQAVHIGLVDELGSLRTAIGIAKDRAGLVDDPKLVLYPRLPSFWEELLGGGGPLGMLSAGTALDQVVLAGGGGVSLLDEVRGARDLLERAPLLASGQPVLLAPYSIHVH